MNTVKKILFKSDVLKQNRKIVSFAEDMKTTKVPVLYVLDVTDRLTYCAHGKVSVCEITNAKAIVSEFNIEEIMISS